MLTVKNKKDFCFRRGTANMSLQEFDLAEKDLIRARKLEPKNRLTILSCNMAKTFFYYYWTTYYMSKKSWPILFSRLLHEMGHEYQA